MEGRQQELKEVFNLLESQETHVIEDIKNVIKENLSSCRESWLIQSLVDYYYTTHSRSVVSIITELGEPHDKYFLDKLHDGIKSPEHQLLALQLLLHVVCRQPTWISKVVTSSVLKVIIKCLKVETNIPVLMTGVTIVAILLPSVPTLIGPYLPDLFEIFNRLAAFSVKKPAGNIPDVFLLHLEVAVYALFHRLYGMFPYNFLTYLRHYYMKKENMQIFQEVVQSMLERVRLHPNLFIGTKEQEVSKERWRQMECQDVVIECAKMSLDMVEGTWEQLHCPIVSSRYFRRKPLSQQRTQFSQPNKNQGYAALPKPSIQSINLENVYWSPSEVVGLSTPPASQRNTPAPSVVETSVSSGTQHHVGHPALTPLMTTPANTPRETPPISDDIDKARAHGHGKLPDPKRLSSEFSHAQTVPLLTPSSHIPSIPPSPLKPEFTSTPPFGLICTQPVLTAARELQFDNPPAGQSDTSPQEMKSGHQSFKNVKKPGQLDLSEREPITQGHDSQPATPSSAKWKLELDELSDSLSRPGSSVDLLTRQRNTSGDELTESLTRFGSVLDSESRHRNRSGGSRSGTVHMDDLSQVIEGLENEEAVDADDEVSELTSSTRSHSAYAMLTAESVAKFMKSVNRIRFNSLTSRNSVEKLTKLGSKAKSLSCPQLPKIDSMMEEDEELSRSVSTTAFQNTSRAFVQFEREIVDGDEPTRSMADDPNLSVTSTSSTVTITTKQESLVTMSTPEANLNISKCPMYSDTVPINSEKKEDDFTRVFRLLLNPSSVGICQKCQSQTVHNSKKLQTSQLENDGPLFSRYSPPELLDRHLKLGSDIHIKELSKIPIPSTQNVNWTHFGGVPPADEINILRGQLLLLHNQLLYERHKREQHAKRNRRLLRKIVHAKTLEEQNRVMIDQIHLNENTIRDMQVSLKLLLEENRKLKNAQESEEYEKIVHLRTCLQENEDLKAAKKEFNTLFVRQREEQDNLRKKLMASEAKLFNTEKELECMKKQAVLNSKLKEQMIQLHKELLLMGELQQKSQQKIQSLKIAKSARHEHEHMQACLSAEIKVLKSKLERNCVQLGECRKHMKECQEQLNIKDMALVEAKRNIEKIKTSHDDEIKSVQEKHHASLNINQALEAHILQVYREIEEIKSKARKQGLHRHPSLQADTGLEKQVPGIKCDDLLPESRDRTNSDPLQPKRKQSLTRMTSEPLSASQPSGSSLFHQNGEGSRSQDKNVNNSSRAKGESSKGYKSADQATHEPGFSESLDMMESGDFVMATVAKETDEHDLESLSSRSSILPRTSASLLYTDSEDNRSMSNRSSGNLGDSGYMG